MLTDIQYIGPDTLPKGWQRPTKGLLEWVRLLEQEGIAPPHAPHLLNMVLPTPTVFTEAVEESIAALQRFVDPQSNSPFQAVGMAHPQLHIAQHGPMRMFAAMVEMTNLAQTSRVKGKVFLNPIIRPIEEEGKHNDVEMCYSCPGIAAVVERWKAVELTSTNHPRLVLRGAPARIVQHEGDHLINVFAPDRAINKGRLLYVPRELRETFFRDFVYKGRTLTWPHTFPVDQWCAMVAGEYSLNNYLRLL